MEKELQEIRKEIVEARNLVIKNDHLLKNLGADLKAFGKKQESFERRGWISSAVAYALFAVLATLIAGVGARGWVAQARSEAEALSAKAEAAIADAAKARAELERRQAASAAGMAAYAKLDSGSAEEREAAALALASVDRTQLTPLEVRALEDHGQTVLRQIGREKAEAGRALHRRKDFAGAVAELKKGLALWPEHPDATELNLTLALAATETRDWPTLAEAARRYLDGGSRNRMNRAYAHFLLGVALDETGHPEDAAEALRKGIADYPDSDHVLPSKRRLSQIRRAGAAEAAPTAAAD